MQRQRLSSTTDRHSMRIPERQHDGPRGLHQVWGAAAKWTEHVGMTDQPDTTHPIECRVLPKLPYAACNFAWISGNRRHSCCLHVDHGSPSCSCWCGASRLRAGGSVVQVPGMSDQPNSIEVQRATPLSPRAWRGTDSAPEGEVLQLLALGFVEWIYATRQNGIWRDANGSAVAGLAWRYGDVE